MSYLSLEEMQFIGVCVALCLGAAALAWVTRPKTLDSCGKPVLEDVPFYYQVQVSYLHVHKVDRERVQGAAHYINLVFSDYTGGASGGGTPSEMYTWLKQCAYNRQEALRTGKDYFAMLNMHDDLLHQRIVDTVAFYPHAFKLVMVAEGEELD